MAADSAVLRMIQDGHAERARHVVLSLDGARLAGHGCDGRLVVWDARTGQCLCVGPIIRVECYYIAFSPNGDLIAFGEYPNGYVAVWNIERKQVQQQSHNGACCTTWTPDGSGVVYGCTDGTVERWVVATGERVWQKKHHAENVLCVAIALGGQTGASGSQDKTVRTWQVEDGQLLRVIQTGSWVYRVDLAPDGQRLAGGLDDGTVEVWDVATGQLVHELRGHTECVVKTVFMPCGRRVISASCDDTARIWDAVDGQLLETLCFECGSVCDAGLAPDGTVRVAIIEGADVLLWRMRAI